MTKFIIRTSDRKKFKECRLAWDLGSKIRQNLEPKAVRTPLDFGTEIHAGLEKWYDPMLWDWDADPIVRAHLAFLAFKQSWKSHKDQYADFGQLSVEVQQDMDDRMKLGTNMLTNYFKYSIQADKDLTPVYTEVEFEVPILVPKNFTPPSGFRTNWPSNELEYFPLDKESYGLFQESWGPVVYQGRVDLIVQDSQGRYWIVDHKTAGQLWDDTSFLELDEQMKSYAWAIQFVLGIKVAGVIYNELYKGFAAPPQRLKTTRKGLSFSTSKQQDTSFELALETFRTEDRAAFKAGLYDPYLTWLKEEGRQYIRRNRISYTQETLAELGDQICYEAIDMLSDPYIYRNPNKWNCKWCDFRTPCLAMADGQPVDWIKDTMYIRRPANASN